MNSNNPRELPYGRGNKRSRSRSRSPPPWRRDRGDRRARSPPRRPHPSDRDEDPETSERRKQERFVREQTRINALQESEQMREWVAQEDQFVLKQAKRKAEIRVKEGRAKPIDWLAVNLRVIDPERNPLDDEIADEDLDVVDPEGLLEGLDEGKLDELEKDIDTYIGLEKNKSNQEFWNTMKVICRDRRERSENALAPEGRAVNSVAADIDRILSMKSLEDLVTLEKQIVAKLASNEPIDVDYWNQLLRSLRIWKAKSSLKQVYASVIRSRLEILHKQQREDADTVKRKLEAVLGAGPIPVIEEGSNEERVNASVAPRVREPITYSREMDPEPLLKIRFEDRALENMDEKDFLRKITTERRKVLKLGYVPMKQKATEKQTSRKRWQSKQKNDVTSSASRFAAVFNDDFSQATKALYEREVARGVGENEEIFTGEEEVSNSTKPVWADKYRPRKPRYFNRVQMGYEWNKYNQTHYDHDNPPPKVVQGYKFNIFYPDLIDKTKAPTYRIEREGGRKRGQSFAPAGEDDTCLIRFIAGPPYEDLAFRIVDKEWDYSAKRERGFKSSFDKGILQLHFQLKKIYYRK
ncbi:cactin [Terfezia boudieri ATCC MYA-4762]|uniref:Splicing factor Cactin n=1 Tax=Terfezia boudieri ATCC MYA-4762 TaxID=1051890 RepID=A0A3N4LEV8_9PEZI|nr:cactin [Terfezia boudieri ATCC MYA-4762]